MQIDVQVRRRAITVRGDTDAIAQQNRIRWEVGWNDGGYSNDGLGTTTLSGPKDGMRARVKLFVDELVVLENSWAVTDAEHSWQCRVPNRKGYCPPGRRAKNVVAYEQPNEIGWWLFMLNGDRWELGYHDKCWAEAPRVELVPYKAFVKVSAPDGGHICTPGEV